ncbi:MAG TPA: phosphonate ABC transporter, permease protein PhnE, partial [Candidatus Binatia bacterium]|nr:phosphonate ABC transporter, permease protein PhnE [Candidatus Binatia bacterium]
TASAPCAAVGDLIQVSGEGFFPNFEGELRWVNPIGDVQRVIVNGEPVTFVTDDEGRFETNIRVPLAVPITQQPEEGETQTHVIRAQQMRPFGPLIATQTLDLVIEKIGETIALAFMATVMGVIFAVPFSFLAARNLMEGNIVTRVIYYVTRTLLNVIRSIETLMWAIIFVVWVGLGPFAGTLALWLHTVAALGKLYSEAIESIDPGPIEAIRATGARWPQMVVYAVFPQILPTFTSFTLYRWDINVRLSTVIGLVSDAGLGFLVIQWIRLTRFSAMATAIIAIVIVVASLDYFSGWLRERIITGTRVSESGSTLRRTLTRGVAVAAFVLLFVWSWGVAEIDLGELAAGASNGLRLARAFAVPDMFDRPEEEVSLTEPLPVPCGAAEVEGAELSNEAVEAGMSLTPTCGDVGTPLLIQASGLPPNQEVSVRWLFPDGAFLRISEDCCATDEQGELSFETEIGSIVQAGLPEDAEEPVRVAIVWSQAIGPLQFSNSFRTVVDLSIVTLLMALMATTLGSIFAIPLSFLAARNVMGRSSVGRAVYYIFRTSFNITRSVEPLILVLIAAAWVGVGPFAGMLALALNNIPNLGKLFSESIEEIDPGPVDAIKATGANRMQTLVYGYVPQLVPRFLAFILYQWDINIRMSTVIGFVGGGGIGQQFRIWVGLNQYAAAGMATWAIVAMVWTMDYLSARAREEMV